MMLYQAHTFLSQQWQQIHRLLIFTSLPLLMFQGSPEASVHPGYLQTCREKVASVNLAFFYGVPRGNRDKEGVNEAERAPAGNISVSLSSPL